MQALSILSFCHQSRELGNVYICFLSAWVILHAFFCRGGGGGAGGGGGGGAGVFTCPFLYWGFSGGWGGGCLHVPLCIEGFRPEWCISTIYHAWDTPFWSGTLWWLCIVHNMIRSGCDCTWQQLLVTFFCTDEQLLSVFLSFFIVVFLLSSCIGLFNGLIVNMNNIYLFLVATFLSCEYCLSLVHVNICHS